MFVFDFEKHMHSKRVPIFLRLLVRPGRSTAKAHMQSVRACAVEAHGLLFEGCPTDSFKNTYLGLAVGSNVRKYIYVYIYNF